MHVYSSKDRSLGLKDSWECPSVFFRTAVLGTLLGAPGLFRRHWEIKHVYLSISCVMIKGSKGMLVNCT
ncbi:UNVERIFIED_CONTAM: hypothetical protein FKN15_023711 [Acipenser sinensis]